MGHLLVLILAVLLSPVAPRTTLLLLTLYAFEGAFRFILETTFRD